MARNPSDNKQQERQDKMPLAPINFAAAPSFEPLPAGTYEGKTVSWEAKDANDGQSTNIVAKFLVEYEDPSSGDIRTRTITTNWNLKDTALWRVKRDLIALGCDPADFEGNAVDIEARLNEVFGPVPTPVRLVLTQRSWRPKDADPDSEPRISNDVQKVELAA